MSYKISVPIISDNVWRQGKELLLEQLRELDAERVFLAVGCYMLDGEERAKMLAALKENCEYFHAQGLEVGAWLWSFMFEQEPPFTHMRLVKEHEEDCRMDACPLDEGFLAFSGEYLQDLARCDVDLIMFDDDLRYSFRQSSGMACICELHRKRICERLGEEISREELAKRILEKPNNPYRDAWLAENGYAFENFAKSCRKYVDEVNPSVRVGYCACMGAWDIDGTDAMTLSKLFAGNTRPFIRLIGAPYWADRFNWGNALQDVVEVERMESSWMKRDEIEIMAEGDVYPRPRVTCPAAYLEGFDTAIRAAGCTDGILKYGIDYTSSTRYEKGYIEYHKHNRPLYAEIHEAFDGKDACGIRIYESPKKVARVDSSKEALPDKTLQNLFFSNAARMLDSVGISATYEGSGVCGMVFGDSVRDLTHEQRAGGLIIDGSAAVILHEMGIDVGIETVGAETVPAAEYFLDTEEWVCTYGVKVFAHTFKQGIEVLSQARSNSGISLLNGEAVNEMLPMSYFYENADGERYLVLNFNGRFISKDKAYAYFLRQYARGVQIASAVPWLSRGKALPASCVAHPWLYMIAKEKDGALSVGLWNFFADPVWEPTVELGEEYGKLRMLGGAEGRMDGKRVTLGTIPAYGFVGFTVSK